MPRSVAVTASIASLRGTSGRGFTRRSIPRRQTSRRFQAVSIGMTIRGVSGPRPSSDLRNPALVAYTPMTVKRVPATSICRPIGSPSPKSRAASVSFTMATVAAASCSVSLKFRPGRMSATSVVTHSGLCAS